MWLRYLIFFIFVYLVIRGLKSFLPQDQKERRSARNSSDEDMVKDPNCNTYIPLNSAIVARVNGRHYYFCSKECVDAYRSKT